MTAKISKTNVDLNSRLDEIQMSTYDRVRAKAQLARAEAIADGLAAAFGYAKRLLTPAGYRRATAS
jgi:hypothetical protein